MCISIFVVRCSKIALRILFEFVGSWNLSGLPDNYCLVITLTRWYFRAVLFALWAISLDMFLNGGCPTCGRNLNNFQRLPS
jgi:hypothetical protein